MNKHDIFLAAIAIADPAQRQAYVEQACEDDAQLRAKVTELLRTHEEASGYLDTPSAIGESASQETVGHELLGGSDELSQRPSGVASFRKYLEPSTRPGWLGRLGHYEVEEILGQGAFGIVAKAFDEKLHRVVAIKMLSPELATISPPRKRFLREARCAAAVPHENLVGIFAVEDEPVPYLVMEYIPGDTLKALLDQNGPLEVADVLRIGHQIAAGMAAAHAANLIHRDIKPSNILLTEGPNERVKISDFGMARAVDDASMTSSGMIAGTPMYMAPEQARGETLDHRADLFSLGSVLYQMTSGRPPFRAPNTMAVLKRVCEDTPRSITDIVPRTPPWLCSIIDRLLEKNPDDRFQSAHEVADLLPRCQKELELNGKVTCVDELIESRKKQADPASPPSTFATPSRPLWLVGGAMAALATVVTTFIYFSRDSSAPTNPGIASNDSSDLPGKKNYKPKEQAVATPTGPYAHDRAAAEWVLSVGGTASIFYDEKGKEVANHVTSPDELPQEPFGLFYVDLYGKGSVNNTDLERLVHLPRLQGIKLQHTSIDHSVFEILTSCPKLLDVAFAFTGVRTSGFDECDVPPSLVKLHLNSRAVDDDWEFLSHLPNVRAIHLWGNELASLGRLIDYPQLRQLRLPNLDEQLVDLNQVTRLQKANPNLRIFVGGEQQKDPRVIGIDPVVDRIRQLKSLGVMLDGYIHKGDRWSTRSNDDESTSKTLIVDALEIPADATLSDQQLRLIPGISFYLQSVKAEGVSRADSFVKMLAAESSFSDLLLQKSDLTDDGLKSLRDVVWLNYLNVAGTNVTQAAVEEFHRCIPSCTIVSSFGTFKYEHKLPEGWGR